VARTEFLGGQPANAFAVHRQAGGARGRDDLGQALGFDLDQRVGGDGLDFGDDELRSFLLDQTAQRGAVGHVDHVRPMRDLLAGGIGVAIDGDHLDAEPLQRDDHFLAEFAGAEQHDAQGAGGQRGTNLHGKPDIGPQSRPSRTRGDESGRRPAAYRCGKRCWLASSALRSNIGLASYAGNIVGRCS
jgi:hypothetical protein